DPTRPFERGRDYRQSDGRGRPCRMGALLAGCRADPRCRRRAGPAGSGVMAPTLKSVAGAAFRSADVISAMHAPLTPEQLVLDNYVFLPHARTGIAAALSTPF